MKHVEFELLVGMEKLLICVVEGLFSAPPGTLIATQVWLPAFL
jgi:hypothetical protein